jgi:tRNA(Ile)-lysidine synthase
MGPHPAVAEVRLAVRHSLARLPARPVARVLVACSGGADSLALAAALAFEAPRAGIQIGLVSIDHGLQDGSDARAEQVAEIGRQLGFGAVHVVPVAVGSEGGPEAAARDARYAALEALASASSGNVCPPPGAQVPGDGDGDGDWVALGHTLDDQAESVLLGLGRGSGPVSIAGMRPVTGRYLRPLLGVRRATTRAACAAQGLVVWDDPHNLDPSYRRVRLRTEALPLLEEVLDGGVAPALARTAQLLREDLDALDEIARGHLDAAGRELDAADLLAHPPAIRSRILKFWAESNGATQLGSVHVAGLQGLVVGWHGQGPVQLPGGFEAIRTSGRLCMRPTGQQSHRRSSTRE